MPEHDYLLAWSLYAVAALGCLLVWMRMTSWVWRWLRQPLAVLVAVLLFSPTVVDPGKEQFAPSLAMTAMDLLLKVGNNAWRAVADMSLYAMLALAAYLLYALLRWPFERAAKARRQHQATAASGDDEPTLREVLERSTADSAQTRTDSYGERRLRIEPRL